MLNFHSLTDHKIHRIDDNRERIERQVGLGIQLLLSAEGMHSKTGLIQCDTSI